MFYTKLPNKREVPIESVFTRCFYCKKEIEVDSEMLCEILKDGDLLSTQVACCSLDKPVLVRIK